MKDQVGAMVEWAAEIGGGKCRIHQQRQPVLVGYLGHHRNIENVQPRIAQYFAEKQPGVRANCGPEGLRISWVPQTWSRSRIAAWYSSANCANHHKESPRQRYGSLPPLTWQSTNASPPDHWQLLSPLLRPPRPPRVPRAPHWSDW